MLDELMGKLAIVGEKSSCDSYKRKFKVDYLQKFAKVIMYNVWNDGTINSESVYCFVALDDFENKTLGKVKKGDIMLPASWKSPAKHARGNIFEAGYEKCLGEYGVAYLRG